MSIAAGTAAACATSEALAADPTKEQCIAANESAQDLRQAGKLRDARARIAVCLAQSCPAAVRDDCETMRKDIDVKMPSIVFAVKDGAGNDLTDVRVTIDGRPFAERLDGTPVDVDPGEHRFAFEAAALPRAEKTILVLTGEKARRVAIVLVASVPSKAPASSDAGTRPEAPASGAPDRTLAYVAWGVGGAGLLVGLVTGLVAGSKHSTLAGECDANNTCPPSAQNDLDSFHAWRTISTVSYVIGAAGLVGGAVLWFSATPPKSTTTARVWIGPLSAGVAGAF